MNNWHYEILLLLTVVYSVLDALGHHYVGEQISGVTFTEEQKISKGKWHLYFGLTRVAVWLGLSFIGGDLLLGIIIGIIIWLGHEVVPNGFKINLTCEKWGEGKSFWQKIISFDFDCFTIWVKEKLKINIRIVVAVLLIISIIFFVVR